MNKLITFSICLIFFLCDANAQRGKIAAQKKLDKANLKYYDLIFKDSEVDFKVSEAPSKWSDESKVMLAQKFHLSFFRNPKEDNNSIKGVIRKRILLQDKNAVEDFSEFYFQESETIRINLFKKSGKKISVDLTNAIEVETEVPDYYSSTYQSSSYKKLAIPNLEVGDIIDYFVVFTEYRNTTISFFSTLSETYPVLAQEIIFDIDKLWSFYFNSFNDAPMFKVMAVSPANLLFRSSKRDEIDRKIDVLSTAKKMINQLPDSYVSLYTKDIKSRVKKASKTKVAKSKMINNIYYFIRNRFLSNNTNYDLDWHKEQEMRSDFFAKTFAEALAEYDFLSSIVVAVPPVYGTLKDVVSDKEIVFGVYVPTTKSYYWPVNSYNNHENGYAQLSGAEGYQIKYKTINKRKPEYKKIKIPTSNMEDNLSENNSEISISDQLNEMNIVKQSTYDGAFKSNYSSQEQKSQKKK